MNILGWLVLFIAVFLAVASLFSTILTIFGYVKSHQHPQIKKRPTTASILFIISMFMLALILTPIAFVVGRASTPEPINTRVVQSPTPSSRTSSGNAPIAINASDMTATATAHAQGIYEAESLANDVRKPAYIEKCPKCSNGHMVASVGRNYITNPPSEGYLQFNNVYAPHSGTYSVTISYCLSNTVLGNILINNATLIQVTYTSVGNECFQDGAAGPGEVAVNIPLQQGENTLKFTSPQSPGTMGAIPSIDCIKIHY